VLPPVGRYCGIVFCLREYCDCLFADSIAVIPPVLLMSELYRLFHCFSAATVCDTALYENEILIFCCFLPPTTPNVDAISTAGIFKE
jgi:hypothetical protein